jgi:hypothetical protein
MNRNQRTFSKRGTGGPLLIVLGAAMLFVALLLGTGTPQASARVQVTVTPVGTLVVETATASGTVAITGTASVVVTGTTTAVVTGTTTAVVTGTTTAVVTGTTSPIATVTAVGTAVGTVVTGTTTVEATTTAVSTAEGTVTVAVDTSPTVEGTVEATVVAGDTPTAEATVEATATPEGNVLPVSGAGSSGNNTLVFITLATGVALITIGLAASFGRRRSLHK